ncbi:MAG: metallophosphoesterase [Planctomycetota bacterium]
MRLAILADCHVSSPNAPDSEENHAQGLGMLERAVERIGELPVDHTIIVGDLVNMGYEEEYADAKRVLAPLADTVTVLPGNHEMVDGDLHRFVEHFGHPVRNFDIQPWRALTLNTAQQSMDRRLWFGEMCAESRAMVNAAIRDRRPLLVFAHHPFSGTVRSAPYPMMSQINDELETAGLIGRDSTTIVFTGHAHRADVQVRGKCVFVGCPPLCFWPHAFLTIEFTRDHVHVKTRLLVRNVADSPDPKTRNGERHLKHCQYIADCEPPMPSFSIRVR